MSNCLVLGSNGFVGSHFLRLLQANRIPARGLGKADLDLCQPESATKLASLIEAETTLVFVSALTPDKGRDSATLMRNLQMAQHVCAALEQRAPAYVLYVSSDAVYSDADSLVRETSPCDPASFHGLMHSVREKLLLDVCKRKQIPLLLARPCAVYGAGDTHNSYGPNRFISSARSTGTIAISGEGEERRDHLYIEDLSRLLLACVQRKYCGALNLASGHSSSFLEVAQLVEQSLGKKDCIRFQARSAPITHKHFDCTRLAQVFPGFQFTALEEGIRASLCTQ